MYILETAKIIHGLVFPDTDSLKQSFIQNEFGVLNIYLYPSLSVMVFHATCTICTFSTIDYADIRSSKLFELSMWL